MVGPARFPFHFREIQVSRACSRSIRFVALVAVTACSSSDAPDDAASSPGTPTVSDAPAVPALPASEPTAADFTSYALTMDKMRKWAAVTKNWATIKGTADDTAAMRTVRIGIDPVADSERRIEGIEPLKRIFTAEGITPREYHMITGAYAMSSLPTSANAEFVKTNKAELDKLMEDLKTAGR